MATATATRLRSLTDMARGLTQLRSHMRELGMTTSVWDNSGRMVGKLLPCCQLCQTIHEMNGSCQRACAELAEEVTRSGAPGRGSSPAGCCVLGTPVVERRRTLGCVVACYLPRELMADESAARLCDQMGLDLEATASMVQQACRHSADQADDFLRVLTWLLGKEQSMMTAQKELSSLSANLASTYEELSLLYAVSGSMRVNCSSREFLQNVCREILEVVNISAAAGVIYAREQGDQEIVVAGEPAVEAAQVQELMDRYLAPLLADSQEPVLDNAFPSLPGDKARVASLLAVPLTTEESSVGVLIALNKRSGDFDSVDVKLVKSIGALTAVFLEYTRLYADTKDLLMGVLHALTASIDAKDPYTSGHSHRVALISRRIAQAAGLSPERAQRIYLAGLLHDVGKIGVPESVLSKPGKLNEQEWKLVKEHPTISTRILGGIRQFDDVLVGILTHQERPDGAGYPRGLAGEEVPLEGRIIGLADSLDAMTSDRTYRPALSLEQAAQEIRRVAGTQLDANLVELVLSMDLGAVLAGSGGEQRLQAPVGDPKPVASGVGSPSVGRGDGSAP
ncbi:MAG: HD domain-containing protein [Phycisphaerae bacterium]|nr:HD domain-containing protein [Phycisphaerae bacterium]